MQGTLRACAWIDRATLDPCCVEIPAYVMTVETTATALALTVCTDHLGPAITTAFLGGGVPVRAVHVVRYHAA